MKKIISFLLSIVFCCLFFSSCSLFPEEEDVLVPPLVETTELNYSTAKVTRGEISATVEVSAIFKSQSCYDVYFSDRAGYLTELNIREGQKISKGAVIAKLDTAELETKIANQKLELERQTIYFRMAKNAADATADSIRLAEMNYQAALNQLELYQKELSKMTLTAPISGQVIFCTYSAIGSSVNAKQVIATIADTASMYLEYTSNDAESGASMAAVFHPGAEITARYQSQTYTGKVVASSADCSMEVLSQHNNLPFVDIVLDDFSITSEDLGHSARITLVTEYSDNAIIVPRNAVNTSASGDCFVQILENQVVSERAVEIGITNKSTAEIKSGLSEGELVIVK